MHSPRVEEALEPEHRTDPGALMRRWSCSTTLLRYGQVRIWTAPSRTVIEFVIHTHAAQGGMGWFEAVKGNHTRIAVMAKRFTQRRLWRR